jgi:hypothetical protein
MRSSPAADSRTDSERAVKQVLRISKSSLNNNGRVKQGTSAGDHGGVGIRKQSSSHRFINTVEVKVLA